MPQFEKGNPGRPEGAKNKVSRDLVKGVLGVFENLGGWDEMEKWANASRRNKEVFYGWVMKMLPANINMDVDGGMNITINGAFEPKLNNDKSDTDNNTNES